MRLAKKARSERERKVKREVEYIVADASAWSRRDVRRRGVGIVEHCLSPRS